MNRFVSLFNVSITLIAILIAVIIRSFSHSAICRA